MMAEDEFDIEALLEAPYANGVSILVHIIVTNAGLHSLFEKN